MMKKILKSFKVLTHAALSIAYFYRLRAVKNPRFIVRWRDRSLHFLDATVTTGFDRHYLLHVAWASRVLASISPDRHVDIASSLSFATTISAFIPVQFIDIRPPRIQLNNLTCLCGSLMNLPFPSSSVNSLSCMHVIEHIGLGRYGDPYDPEGDLKAVSEIKRVLANHGHLLFVVPIGGEAVIQFNAHRIYTYRQICELFNDYKLMDFSLIPDDPSDGDLVMAPDEPLLKKQLYGCGCFHFIKG
jgi:SAM-dependent methyltransferase